ncbi:MAG TPA: serine hydrolase [Streptosporangiaceae bacterium]
MRRLGTFAGARFAGVALPAVAIVAAAGLLAGGGSRPGLAASPAAAAARRAAAAVSPPALAADGQGLAGPALAPAAAPARPGRRPACGCGPLAGVAAYLRGRAGVVQVALYDRATGRTSLVSDGPATQYTASIVKADILASWLRRYQSRPGTIPASIPYSVRYLMQNMITMSDNVAATGLFYFGGGCTALTRFNTRIPTRDTAVGCQTPTYYGWGNTTTTAADQAAIVRTLAYPGRVLAPDARAYGVSLMESVIPAQRWGVTCGPWGTDCAAPDYARPVPGVTVALKNGWKFVPGCTAQDESCPWQVNSIGWVSGAGRDYVLAVLTTDDPAGPGLAGFDYGIATTQGVSKLVWANLKPR